jgi:SGNH domain (fused to AT3 domains)
VRYSSGGTGSARAISSSLNRVAVVLASLLVAIVSSPLGVVGASSPAPTASGIAADIAHSAGVLRTKGVISYAGDPAIKNYVVNHGADHPSYSCLGGKGQVAANPCTAGDLHAHATMVALGDSHGWQWMTALSEIAAARHLRLVTFFKASCPAEISVVPWYQQGGSIPYSECTAWRTNVLAAVAKLHPRIAVFSEITQGAANPSLAVGMGPLLTALIPDVGGVARNVVWIESSPVQTNGGAATPAACLATRGFRVIFSAGPTAGCFQTYAGATGVANNLPEIVAGQDSAATGRGITVVNPLPLLCQTSAATGICPPVIEGHGVYFDNYHVADSFAVFIEPILESEFPK